MPFAALDLHKLHIEAVLIADDGAVLHRQRFPTTRSHLLTFAKTHLSPAIPLAVEATFNTWPIVNLLEPFVAEVVVGNPLRTRAIAEAKIKTDRVDALVLANLLRLDFLPRVWKPDEETRYLRSATTERANLVADRTRIKNRIHAVLHQQLISAPKGDLFSRANLAWLEALQIDPRARESLNRHLRQLVHIESEIGLLRDELAAKAWEDPRARLLMTLPGVDFTVAMALLAALGDFSRFPDADRAAAYLGLVPSTRQSGENCYHGPITKQGRSHARWLLVQAAQHVDRHPGPLGHFFRRLAKRKNRNVAVVATARKLVTIAWHMLKNNEPYRYGQPATAQAKFARLRVQATGQRRTGGNPKGSGRPAAYGTGQGSKAVPALARVYQSEGIPPARTELPPGEIRAIQESGAAEFVDGLTREKRVPKIRKVTEGQTRV